MEKWTSTDVVFFSPTRTSEKIAKAVASGIGMPRRRFLDLTYDDSMADVCLENSVAVIAVPVYAGRVAPTALARLGKVRANGCPAVLLAVYGNRDYEDALIELYDFAVDAGFEPVAAGAFIGEHSYSRMGMPIAEGRPDADDLETAIRFGKSCLAKLETEGWKSPLSVKGNRPYREVKPSVPSAPVCNENCFGCGECIQLCPTKAISRGTDGGIETEALLCIKCCACVKGCPNAARVFDTPYTAMLHKLCSQRKEPELFI